MHIDCTVCGKDFNKLYRKKDTKYVPSVCGSNCFKRLIKENNNTTMNNPPEGAEKFRFSMSGMRSEPERKVAQWLTANSIVWKYESYIFTVKRGVRYLPDFYLPSFDMYLEVKGRWEVGAREKFLAFIKRYGYTIHLLDIPFVNLITRRRKGLG